MPSGVRSFMEGLIDYAGLFPPAALPLEQMVRLYTEYRSGRGAWMLGRLVIPAAQLDELEPQMRLFSDDFPLSLSVLGSRSRKADECRELLRDHLHKVAAFRNRHGESLQAEVLEIPLPPDTVEPSLLESIASASAAAGMQTFCELAVERDADWEVRMQEALDRIASCNEVHRAKLGIKWRTGGVAPDAIPSPRQVAAMLTGCRDRAD